jgi:aspartate carbamoyltransferase catalytic subunit
VSYTKYNNSNKGVLVRHILSAEQFTVEQLADIFARTDEMRGQLDHNRQVLVERHKGIIAATLFYEPSTRTRLSFESAAQRLGMGIISTENAKEFSSNIKGETLEDSIITVSKYADVIILRHSEDDSAERAANASDVPIINAGAGKGEHPTQALLDLYTIKHAKGRTDNLHIVIGGDLEHGRTARSLARLLALYSGNRITFVSTPELQIGDDIKTYLDSKGIQHAQTSDLSPALHSADVVYWTRLQKERHTGGNMQSNFSIGQAELDVMPDDAIILHPLPRNDEIQTIVDNDPRARYFDQVQNGLYVRMALLDMLATKSED